MFDQLLTHYAVLTQTPDFRQSKVHNRVCQPAEKKEKRRQTVAKVNGIGRKSAQQCVQFYSKLQ